MNILSREEAFDRLKDLRRGRRGKESMFDPWLEEIKDLDEGEVFTETVEGYGRVSGLRNLLESRGIGDQYNVKSARENGQGDLSQDEATYEVFVFLV